MLKIKISLEIFHSFLIISLYFLKILSVISQKLSVISQKTLYNLSKNSLHILSFNLSLYSHSIINKILTHDHLETNFTFVLVIFITEKAESLHTIPQTGSFLIQESAGWFFVTTTHGLTSFFSAGWWGKPAPNARKTEFGAKKVA